MEYVIYYEYCSSNNLLTSKNSGFKKHDSTVNRLLDLTTKIYQSLGDGSDVLMVFLDVTKAFDKVYHRGLRYKLGSMGIEDPLLGWLKSYLSCTCRLQRVVKSLSGVR